MCKTVNIKKEKKLLEQYIDLRNKYSKDILSRPVTYPATIDWLKKTDVEIYGLVKNDNLLGVILIYIEKGNEVTFFAKEPGKGIGDKLLKIADRIAKKRKLSRLWAWTRIENLPAIKAFEKNSYKKTGVKFRKYQGEKIKGYIFIKSFSNNQ